MAKTAMQLSLDARLAIGARAAGISLGRAAQHWQDLLVHFVFDGEATRLDGGRCSLRVCLMCLPCMSAGVDADRAWSARSAAPYMSTLYCMSALYVCGGRC